MSRRVWIVIGAIVGVIVVLNLLASGLDRAVGGNEPSGVSGSSYTTGGDGLAEDFDGFGGVLSAASWARASARSIWARRWSNTRLALSRSIAS
jgi:hypothetical protein